MGRVVSGVLMAMGMVFFLASHFVANYMDMSSRDPLVFEHAAYAHLVGYVGITLILVGLLLGAALSPRPPRTPKPPRA